MDYVMKKYRMKSEKKDENMEQIHVRLYSGHICVYRCTVFTAGLLINER